jgi:hypothetical protein
MDYRGAFYTLIPSNRNKKRRKPSVRALGATTMGIQIFASVREALHAGYIIESPVPDSEGFLPARIRTAAGWAKALIRTSRSGF